MTGQPKERRTHETRGGDGKFIRDTATAERDAKAAALRSKGWSFRDLAAELGYASVGAAHTAVQRALKAIVEEPAADVRAMELERLDAMLRAVQTVLEAEHVVVSQGRVVRRRTGEVDDDGEPIYEDVPDYAPVMAAVDRLLKIQERRSRLLGLDAPVKAQTATSITYEIAGVDLEAL